MSKPYATILAHIPRLTWLALGFLLVMAFWMPHQEVVIWLALAFGASQALVAAFETQRTIEARQDFNALSALDQITPQEPAFQGVLRAMPDPVLVISGVEANDLAGRWVDFANEAAMELFQMRKEGGLLVSSVRNPEVLEAVDEALFGNIQRDILFETQGSQTQYWRAFCAPLASEGERHLALLVIRDETDVRRMERMRADFLANASHELRSPLASLIGFIETLRGHAKEDPVMRDKFLGIMQAQAERMGRLISDLLSLSRIEMNEHVPPTGEADVAQTIQEVVEGLTIMAREKEVQFDIKAPAPGLYPLMADRDQIMQVLQNLTDNALKYAPRGSEIDIFVEINQKFEPKAQPNEPHGAKLVLLRPDRERQDVYIKVRITDKGPGIAREYLPRLAERFYRVEGQKSGDRLGTGLGLAIVKHIINRHRGGLVVESFAPSKSPKALDRDVERGDYEPNKVTPIPAISLPTYTSFTVYLPQKALYQDQGEGLKLVSTLPDTATKKPRFKSVNVR